MNKKKIIPRITGGLGNQLFAYAAARRLSIFNNCELVIDDKSGFVFDKKYKRNYQLNNFNILCKKANIFERFEPLSRFRRYISRLYNSRIPFESRSYIVQDGLEFDERLLKLKIKKNTYLEGCWQSEKYFKDIESIIREDLKIAPPTDPDNLRVAECIKKRNSVGIHIRYFDLPNSKDSVKPNNAPFEYYQKAINYLESLEESLHYFIFSDQPMYAASMIPLPSDRFTVVQHNRSDQAAVSDLWLMTLCKHFIIANSTFSWWGAWLSNNKEKIVIAPSLQLNSLESSLETSWGFFGLIPDEWITI